MLPGSNTPYVAMDTICNRAGETIEIAVQLTAEREVENTTIIILKNDVEVARAIADDWEEPSSLSALYRETSSS